MRYFLCLVLFLCGLTPGAAAAESVYERLNPELRDAIAEVLTLSDGGSGFVQVKVEGSEDFVQMMMSGGKLTTEFPIITKRQKKTRRKIMKTGKELGLKCDYDKIISIVTCPLPDSADDITEILVAFLIKTYGATEDTRFYFESHGIRWPATESQEPAN